MNAAVSPQTRPSRFFAITRQRLQLARAARLSAGDLCVWAYVEMEAAPGRPKRFVLEQMAADLGLSPDAVGRSLKRLVRLGVVSRQDLGGRVHLCPATTLGAADEKVGQPPAGRARSADRSVGRRPERPTDRSAPFPESHLPPSRAAASKELEDPKRKKSFSPLGEEETELVADMETRFGIWAAKGRKLVLQHGCARIKDVVAFADFQADRLSNPGGWIQRALEGGWGAPEGFFQAQQSGAEQPKKLDHAAVVARVMTMRMKPDAYSDDEKRQALLDAVAVGEEAPARRLAAAWGIDIGAD